MKLSHYPKMLFSSHIGWDELRGHAPSPRSMMLKLVLPFSLLPALMICYAGLAHGPLYAPAAGMERWLIAAALFFVVELATVPLMAWVLQTLAASHKLSAGFDACFLLAAGAAVPLWLSSLACWRRTWPSICWAPCWAWQRPSPCSITACRPSWGWRRKWSRSISPIARCAPAAPPGPCCWP